MKEKNTCIFSMLNTYEFFSNVEIIGIDTRGRFVNEVLGLEIESVLTPRKDDPGIFINSRNQVYTINRVDEVSISLSHPIDPVINVRGSSDKEYVDILLNGEVKKVIDLSIPFEVINKEKLIAHLYKDLHKEIEGEKEKLNFIKKYSEGHGYTGTIDFKNTFKTKEDIAKFVFFDYDPFHLFDKIGEESFFHSFANVLKRGMPFGVLFYEIHRANKNNDFRSSVDKLIEYASTVPEQFYIPGDPSCYPEFFIEAFNAFKNRMNMEKEIDLSKTKSRRKGLL